MSVPTIRTAEPRDATHIARLLSDLGHPTEEESIRSRWVAWTAAGNSALVAEQCDGDVLGVVTLHQMAVLHRMQPVGRITSLAVAESVRGQGIGRGLVTAADSVLAQAGCGLLEITSHFRWTEAHGFYEHLGYHKTSFRLAKQLAAHR